MSSRQSAERSAQKPRLYAICVYVPVDHAEAVKQAMFRAGAGRLGRYDRCSWQTRGLGQFRPLPGSRPFAGATGRVERTAEVRIEMICGERCLPEAVEALLEAHPYETPAYHYWPVNPPIQP